ncbi:hypothetical protein CVV72_10685 [Amycolatopsis sp. TNS106]|nr:hypothetical protein CVV72_10685 [Amycolatopsis sp. TNS106]
MSNHSHDDGAAITRQTSRTPELMTVAEAFVVHGAAFSRWFDRQPESLPATQQLEVTFDEDGVVRFSVREGNGGADTRAPRFEPAATGRHDADTSAVIGPGQGLPAGAEPPTSIVAGALPDDAELARLTARVTALGAELAREKRRADEAQARLDLVREVLDV